MPAMKKIVNHILASAMMAVIAYGVVGVGFSLMFVGFDRLGSPEFVDDAVVMNKVDFLDGFEKEGLMLLSYHAYSDNGGFISRGNFISLLMGNMVHVAGKNGSVTYVVIGNRTYRDRKSLQQHPDILYMAEHIL